MSENLPKFFGAVLSIVVLATAVWAQSMTDEAQSIYESCHSSVVQIQVIDLATGKKTSIGSGFQFTGDGHIATNFHVVSEAVHSPERFRVESIRHDGVTDPVDVLDIDVIHDLAVVRQRQGREKRPGHLLLGHSDLSKGTHIYSMGNPFDLGMSIVEGIYNGLMEDSLYKKILFSGSINPGMSGGPALNKAGEVIGVNVSTAGNEVSFLVPVEHLAQLYERVAAVSAAPVPDEAQGASSWKKRIAQQLTDNQDQYFSRLFEPVWNTLEVGEAKVPGELLNVFKCWGKSEDKEKDLYNYAYISCSTSDSIFLSPGFSTGSILYKYFWITSKGLNPLRFYNLYENHFRIPNPYENAMEDDASNFNCDHNFVDVGGRDAKVLWCARQYKKFPGLYDINLSLASIDRNDRGLLVEVVALGISEANAVEFARKFLNEIKWQN